MTRLEAKKKFYKVANLKGQALLNWFEYNFYKILKNFQVHAHHQITQRNPSK